MRYPNFNNDFAGFGGNERLQAQERSNTFMQRVYWWMFVGLGLTGAIAWGVGSNVALATALLPFYWPLVIVQLVVVMALSFLASRVSGPMSAFLFLLYSALNGVTLSVIFLAFKLGSIALAFGVAAGAFAALSVFATVTKRDLSGMATFLFIGLFGIVIAGVVNLFVQSDALAFVKSCAAVLVFGGLTAYDTQKLRRFHAQTGYSGAMSLAINGALTLYLDFINLFLNLLWLLGGERRRS
jgi:FtsH-binding integral membrane protein